MRRVPRVLLALSLAAGGAVLPAAAAQAAGSGSLTTAPSAEAWHRLAQACTLPTGCPAAAPSQYPPDTLHVGVVTGQEEARTFLQLDLSGLPSGTKPAGGQLRLPVASGTRDGTRAPEAAKLRACLVTEPVEDADGAIGTGPKVDCDAVSTEAVFVEAAAHAPAAFTVDLAALAAAWSTSAAPGALALLPAEDVGPTDSWHVAFSDRTRAGEGVAKISAAVSFVGTAVDVQQAPPPPVTAPVDRGFVAPAAPPVAGFVAPSVLSLEAPAPVPVAQAAPEAPATAPETAPQQVVPVAGVVDGSFRYPAVFLLPLLVALGVAWLGRALTRDLAADSLG